MIKNVLLNRKLFKTVYIAFLLFCIIPFINGFIVTKALIAAFTVWSVALILDDLVKNRLNSYKNRAFVPLVVFFCFCGLSYIINYENGLVKNIATLGIFFVCAAVLYITASDDVEKLKKEAVAVFKAYSVAAGFLAIVCFVMYLAQFKIRFAGQGGLNYRIGVWENRLFGVFSSSNVGGSIMAIGLFIAVGLLIYLHKNGTLTRMWKIILAVCIFFETCYIALSISRGTYVSLGVAAVVFFALYGYKASKNILISALKRVVCIVCAFAVFYGCMMGIRQASFKTVQFLDSKGIVEIKVDGFDRIEYRDDENSKDTSSTVAQRAALKTTENGSVKNLVADSAQDLGSLIKSTSAKKTDDSSPNAADDAQDKLSDLSNKRLDIWKSSLNLAKNKLLFGTGKYYNEYLNHKDEMRWLSEDDHTYIVWSKGNAHNGYIQILVDAGIFALIAYAVFLVWCLVKNVRAYIKASRFEKSMLALCLAVICYVLVNNLFETNMVLMSSNVIQAIFWFVAGVDMTLCTIILKRAKTQQTGD